MIFRSACPKSHKKLSAAQICALIEYASCDQKTYELFREFEQFEILVEMTKSSLRFGQNSLKKTEVGCAKREVFTDSNSV